MSTELEFGLEEDYEEDNFVDIVRETVGESLLEEIEEEWGNLHHNASLSGSWPDFENDAEAERFWDALGDYAYDAIEMLQDELYDKFGVAWKLYQYGRMGATIAPDELMAPACCGGFGGLNWEKLNYYEVEDLDDILAALRYINKQVREFCENIADWWKEEKEFWKEMEEHS